VFKELHNEFKAALDDAIVSQGEAVSEETEVERLLSGITELIAANPGLIMSLDGVKTIVGSIIGKRMEEGIFFLPAETLNALTNMRVFTQQPSIDSMTKALGREGRLYQKGWEAPKVSTTIERGTTKRMVHQKRILI